MTDPITTAIKDKYRKHKRTIIACGVTALITYKIAMNHKNKDDLHLVMTDEDARMTGMGLTNMRYDTKKYGTLIVRSLNDPKN